MHCNIRKLQALGMKCSLKCEPKTAMHHVWLALSPFGPELPGMPTAYHTSIIVDKVEYCFSRKGIQFGPSSQAHARFKDGPALVIHCGLSSMDGDQLLSALQGFFDEGTYDLLRKNCNHFTDCVLFFLFGRRLDSKYRIMEKFLEWFDEAVALVRICSMGEYMPNPNADGFRVCSVLDQLSMLPGSHAQKLIKTQQRKRIAL
jgi:hypothetical protein